MIAERSVELQLHGTVGSLPSLLPTQIAGTFHAQLVEVIADSDAEIEPVFSVDFGHPGRSFQLRGLPAAEVPHDENTHWNIGRLHPKHLGRLHEVLRHDRVVLVRKIRQPFILADKGFDSSRYLWRECL